MITQLRIANFKSHKDTLLSLKPLTLLTGLNSSGKSSVLQVFLLLRQSQKKGRLQRGLDLNEPLVDIGKGADALFKNAESEIIRFEIGHSTGTHLFAFDASQKLDSTFLPSCETVSMEQDYLSMPIFTHQFQYLSASRLGGIEFYPTDSFAVEEERQLSSRYGQGELVAHYLEYYGENRKLTVLNSLLHPDESNNKLLAQVIAWEREISPRLTIWPEKIADKITLKYGYKGMGLNEPLKDLNAKNIGFGISYSLAIVVAILSAQPGALLLIENPEAHLHPKGQSKLAELMCLAAQAGIQILVETHSDHVLNAVLVGSKRFEQQGRGIDKANVALYYFSERNAQHASQANEINVESGGKIERHLEGFFDQFDIDLQEIMGF